MAMVVRPVSSWLGNFGPAVSVSESILAGSLHPNQNFSPTGNLSLAKAKEADVDQLKTEPRSDTVIIA